MGGLDKIHRYFCEATEARLHAVVLACMFVSGIPAHARYESPCAGMVSSCVCAFEYMRVCI